MLLLALIAACEAPAPPAEPPPPQWVYAPAPSGWPVSAPKGRFGRAQAPQAMASLGIAGTQKVPLRLATLWEVPGEKARAAAYGYEGVRAAVELIDVDAGRVIWRDTTLCTGPIVGVTENAIVCSDGTGVRGVTLDGKSAWKVELPFVAITDDRVVVASDGQAVILDSASGDELSRVKLPPTVVAETIVASCGDAGRELFASTVDRKLQRIADVKGKPAVTWSVPLGQVTAVDACAGDHIVAHVDQSLVAFARGSGAQTGRVDGVRGFWPARDGSAQLEIATIAGVARWTRDLATAGTTVLLVPLGALVSSRGERRLVRVTPSTMAVLDRAGVANYVALGAQGAVLGDAAIVASDWDGSRANTIERFALPARYSRSLRVSMPAKGVAVPTELRDLPAPKPLDTAGAIEKIDTGTESVGPIAIDPVASNIVYIAAAGTPIDDDTSRAIVALDLATKTWLWERSDACGGGVVKAIAVGDDIVACGTQGTRPGTALVRATSRTGQTRWEWEGDGVDSMTASGALLVVASGDRAYVLDAATGHTRLTLAAADGVALVAIVDTAEWGRMVIAAQHGRLVARAAKLDMRPVWTLAIDGVATAVTAAGDGVLVQLEDGDAYRIVAKDGTIIGVPGIGLEWHAGPDLVAGLTAGGALFGAPVPRPPVPAIHSAAHELLVPDDPELPKLWTPIAPPPVVGAGQQLTIYEPTGGVRVRAEYDLGQGVKGARWQPRGPSGSEILLVGDAPDGPDTLLVIDPRTGDPTRRVTVGDDAVVFATIVEGSPVTGAVVAKPLRVILF